MSISNFKNLSQSIYSLRHDPSLTLAVDNFKHNRESINSTLYKTINQDVPDYTALGESLDHSQLRQHLDRHTHTIINIMCNTASIDFDFVEEFNQDRAAERFSLESTLHVYRICQKVYTRHLRDSILESKTNRQSLSQSIAAVDDFTLEYMDVISTLAAQAYIEQSRIMTQAAGDRRAEQLTCLLNGYTKSDNSVTADLADSGYLDEGQLFCVAVARSVDPKQMQNHERARRMAQSIDKLFTSMHCNRLIDILDNKVIMIFSRLKRVSGWTQPNIDFANNVTRHMTMVGNAALIGISTDVSDASQIPKAYKQAQMALRMASPTKRVICAADLSIYKLLILMSGDDIHSHIPHWGNRFYVADDKSRGALSATLRAYAKTNMNILKAGAVLSVHPNTIYSRIYKIQELTGLDPRRFSSLSELLLVCDLRLSKFVT